MSDPREHEPKEATAATRAANAAVHSELPFDDRSDFERAARGLIARPSESRILHSRGYPVWDLAPFEFLKSDEVPATVHPSLWRQGQLNLSHGLFEVAENFYQVRGLDLSNITFIRGRSGWIIIDPLTSTETARAALELLFEHKEEAPVLAVIYTHSHVDHFAGVRGVVDEADVLAGKVRIIAPEGFLQAAISENVIAGTAMGRRASYMYGALLPRGPRGHVDAGLGKSVPMLGSTSLIAPTEEITATGQELEIDGIRIVFQNTPGTEAPAEMNFYFPEERILCMAENCSATLHNVYTPRGAEIRDALSWSKYIQESLELFVDETDVMFASHHWPRWGQADVRNYLEKQRDAYRYIHDQTMRLANRGFTSLEIAEEIELPKSLRCEFFNRDYYGTVNHNVKAVYQRYLGWFDANPAHLHPLPPESAARRYVEYMGGSEAVLERARKSFEQGDYRWVAEVVNHVVFAEPENRSARALQADTLEQLGYQSESGPWRAFYLTAARELRHGSPEATGVGGVVSPDVVKAMTPSMLFDYMAVRLDGPAAEGRTLVFNFEVVDRKARYVVALENSAIHTIAGASDPEADLTLKIPHSALAELVLGRTSAADTLALPGVEASGRDAALGELIALLDHFEFFFPIVSP